MVVVEYRYPGGVDFYLSRTCFYLRLSLSDKQRKCDTVSQNDSISHFFCFYCLLRNTFKRKQGIKAKTPQDTGILPLHSKLYPAISPNRRRIRPRSRPRTISCGLGRSQIGAHTDLHKLYPCHPHIKVLRSAMNPWIHWFISDRSLVPPVPSSPQSQSKKYAFALAICSSNLAALAESFETMSSVPLTIPPLTISRTLMLEKLR